MNTNKVTFAALAAVGVVLTIAVLPALTVQASAIPAEKQVNTTNCDDPKFADRPSCPGKSEDASGGDRDDTTTCTARNNGQAKDCPEGSTIVIVNP
jgi:hypothetical protein